MSGEPNEVYDRRIMRPRRHHLKSRNGCVQCKERRVKCDEQKPKCARCTYRQTECHYNNRPSESFVWVGGSETENAEPERQSSMGSILSGSASPPATEFREKLSTNSTPPVPTSDPFSNPSLDHEGLKLMIHWFTYTIHTVTFPNDRQNTITQKLISQEAMAHDYLMHGILALSALHLAETSIGTDARKYATIARGHHNQGLANHRPSKPTFTASNTSSTLSVPWMSTISALAFTRPLHDDNSPATIDTIAEIFTSARAWHEAARLSGTADTNPLYAPPLPPSSTSTPTPTPLPEKATQAFQRLHNLNASLHPSPHNQPQKELYTHTISSLQNILHLSAQPDASPQLVVKWALEIPEGYLQLLRERERERDPLAMVVLAHFCVVLERFGSVWWLRGWAEGLFGGIWKGLGSANGNAGGDGAGRFREYVEWPMEVLGVDCMRE